MTNECWEWPGHRNRYGYGVLQAYGRGGKHMFAHRLIWEQYAGPIPDGMQVLHQCDNPPCIRPTHLFLGTATDNMRDMAAKGRTGRTGLRGEGIATHRLTEVEVREIRALHNPATMGCVRLARKYGVTPAAIKKIINGKSWAHVTAP